MQKTLFTKLAIIAGLCLIFAIGLSMIGSVIYERQTYAESVVREIAQQYVNPQEVITPFIAIPTTVTPECQTETSDTNRKCASSYTKIETIFANQTQATQDLDVSTDTYQRGIYHATSYNGALTFDQNYTFQNHTFDEAIINLSESTGVANQELDQTSTDNTKSKIKPEKTTVHWDKAKLIIPISDLRGLATLPTVTIDKKPIKATYPQISIIKNITYVEVAIPQEVLIRSEKSVTEKRNQIIDIMVDL
ncbi:MAG: inner membrane CreD family protein, partial [Psychrobacter sp.]|nr:inner membrane CreD family protein [Psychrobacter sp.]